jgi:TP901 family phage tail tape measure protein
VKVADLFAELKIDVDPATVAKLDRALNAADAKIKRKTKGWAKFAKGAAGLAWDATQLGVTALAAGMVVATKDALDFDKALTQLGINSQHALGTYDEMKKRILDVSKATGQAKEEILAGAAAYTAITGDGKGAAEQMETFSKVAVATGSNIEDIARTAAALKQNLQLDPADFEKTFSILIQGGKKGAVELNELASVFAGLAPLANQFDQGAGVKGASRLAAALQLARQGFGSTSEAANGLERLMGSIRQNAKLFKAGGVQVFDVKKNEKGQTVKTLKSFDEIIESIADSKLARDPALLTRAFGSKEAYAAFIQLTKNKGAWDALTESTLQANDVQEDYAEKQASSSFKAEKAWNNLKVAVAEAFTSERLEKFAKGLEKILGITVKIVDALDRHFDTEYSDETEGGKSPFGDPEVEKNRYLREHLFEFDPDKMKKAEDVAARVALGNKLHQEGRFEDAMAVSAGAPLDMFKTGAAAAAGTTVINNNNNPVINVTSNSADPAEVANQVDQRLQQHYRDASASQGAGL